MILPLLLGVGPSVASALVLGGSGCDFQIHAAGLHHGPFGQISSGQVLCGDIEPATFLIKDEQLWGSVGGGCGWTSSTNFLQCNTHQAPVPGFSIGCNGQVSFNGQTTFYRCATEHGKQWNICLQPDAGTNCGEITLVASGCHAESNCPQPAPQPQPKPEPQPEPAPYPVAAPRPRQCPANLNGAYETPDLIIPVDNSNPDKALGTSLFGEVTPCISSLFNFDIPTSDRGKTCSLVFLFPEQSRLPTPSSLSLSCAGQINFSILDCPVSTSTTWNNKPGKKAVYGIDTVKPGHSYTIASFPCPAGEVVSVELDTSGDADLRYLQECSPEPIGLFITKC